VSLLDNSKIENSLEDFQREAKQRHIDVGYTPQGAKYAMRIMKTSHIYSGGRVRALLSIIEMQVHSHQLDKLRLVVFSAV
jgi:hypothetical protein